MEFKRGVKTAVQTKLYGVDERTGKSRKAGVKAIQEVNGSFRLYKCHRTMAITNRTFTAQAVHLAKANEVELWDNERQEEIDEKYVDYKFLPLQDFAHRSEKTCAKWEEQLIKKGSVQLASWAFPGAMQRHNAVAASALSDDPELYPLLLFAPIGCIYFNGRAYARNGRNDPRLRPLQLFQNTIRLNKPVKLSVFTKRLSRKILIAYSGR